MSAATMEREKTDVAKPPKAMAVKLDMDVIESARILSAMRNEPMSDMLSRILRPILQRMEQEEMSKRLRPRRPKGEG